MAKFISPDWKQNELSREVITEKSPNIFTMYEENIGLLTPMIAEELRDAEKTYPEAMDKRCH